MVNFSLADLAAIDFSQFGQYVYIKDDNFGRFSLCGLDNVRITLVNGKIPVTKAGNVYLIKYDPEKPPMFIDDGIFRLSRIYSGPCYVRFDKK
jgi:hypothetical protein